MVVGRFLPLARQLAAGYAHSSESFDDLYQVACLGLVNAVDRFDTKREIAFSSYAVPTILGELKRYFRDKTWSVRVPRDLQELALGIERASESLTARLGRPPTIDEVADAVGAAREAVLEARDVLGAYHAGSLEDSRSGRDDDDPLLSVLGCDEAGYDRVEQRVLRGASATSCDSASSTTSRRRRSPRRSASRRCRSLASCAGRSTGCARCSPTTPRRGTRSRARRSADQRTAWSSASRASRLWRSTSA
jgi:RNA polymerase sigma factor (sigma-70 family)